MVDVYNTGAGRPEAGAADLTREAHGTPARSRRADQHHGEGHLRGRTDAGASEHGKQPSSSGAPVAHELLFKVKRSKSDFTLTPAMISAHRTNEGGRR